METFTTNGERIKFDWGYWQISSEGELIISSFSVGPNERNHF